MPNPYTWRSVVRDPSMFYGRKQEIQDISSRLCGSVPLSISVVGPRRIGKSSLLWHISRRSSSLLKPEFYERLTFVYIDFQEAGSLTTSDLLRRTLNELDVQSELSTMSEDELKDLLQDNLATLEQRQRSLILVFDEFDSAVRYISAETLDYLRALAKYNLAYIIATKQPLNDICDTLESSPFSNIFTVLPLGLLPEEEAHSLIADPSAQQEVDFTREDLDFILDTAGCHPYLLQIACFYTFENRSNEEGSLSYDEIREQVSADVTPFIQRAFYSLSETAKESVTQMVRGQRPAGFVLNELQMQGIVNDKGELLCSPFREFVSNLVTEHEQRDTSESLLEEVDDLLKKLEQRMRSFIKNHWEIKYGTSWPSNLRKRNPAEFEKWLERMPEQAQQDPAKWQDILRYSDFPDPFQIIHYEWGDLKGIFSFSRDPNKSKRRLEERKEFLTKIRNAIRHSRGEDLNSLELDKARLFCRELLAMLGESLAS